MISPKICGAFFVGAALAFAPEAHAADAPPAGDAVTRCFTDVAKDPNKALDDAQTLYQAGQTIAARHCLGEALVATGDAARGARILEDLAREVSAAPDVSSETQGAIWGAAGRAWLEDDDVDRALAAFDAAIARLPKDAQLRVDRAVALGNARRYWEAIDDLTAAIEGGVDTAEVYLLRASAWHEVGTTELAMEDIDRAAKLAPNNPETLLERGRIRKLANDIPGAEKDFLAVLKLAPGTDAGNAAKHELEALTARQRR